MYTLYTGNRRLILIATATEVRPALQLQVTVQWVEPLVRPHRASSGAGSHIAVQRGL